MALTFCCLALDWWVVLFCFFCCCCCSLNPSSELHSAFKRNKEKFCDLCSAGDPKWFQQSFLAFVFWDSPKEMTCLSQICNEKAVLATEVSFCVYFRDKKCILWSYTSKIFGKPWQNCNNKQHSPFPWWANFTNSTHLVKITSDVTARFQMTTLVHLQVLIGAKKRGLWGTNYFLKAWELRTFLARRLVIQHK